MRPRAWFGVVLMSILGHVALFWPSAVMHLPVPAPGVLDVTLAKPAQRQDPEPAFEPVDGGPDKGMAKGGAGIDGRKMRGVAAGEQVPISSGSSRIGGSSFGNDAGIKAHELAPPRVATVEVDGPSGAVTLDAYRFALAREVLRIQRYPTRLLEQAQGGVVELEVRLPELARSVPAISILVSSGQGALDEAALEAMHDAVRNIPLPVARGSLRLSVLFEADRIPRGGGEASLQR